MEALGLESGLVRVVEYNDEWPALFDAESARVQSVLAERGLTMQLEHTGSTAVPGLAAKPVLDMLGGWQSDADRPALIAAIEAAGYIHRGESGIPGREFFRRGTPRQYHLHLTRIGSDFWNNHRLFRDWLRKHPDDARAYAELKQQLAQQFPNNREAYIDAKTAFVQSVLARARAAAAP